MKESLALMESFSDEFVLLVIEFEDGLLKVTNSSVNEFGRFRRSTYEVARMSAAVAGPRICALHRRNRTEGRSEVEFKG